MTKSKMIVALAVLMVSNCAFADGFIAERGPLECPPNTICGTTIDVQPEGYTLGKENIKKKSQYQKRGSRNAG